MEFNIEKWPKKLMDSCDNLVIVVSEGKIKWVNKKFREVTGLSDSDVLDCVVENLVGQNGRVEFKGRKICTIRCEEVSTCFGRVLLGTKTNGLNEEYERFNTFLNGNKEKVEKIWKHKILST